MTHPESGPTGPDSTPHFQQLVAYLDTADVHAQSALLRHIQDDPQLDQTLLGHLAEGYELGEAINMVHEVVYPADGTNADPFDEVMRTERSLAELQYGDALNATGLQLNPAQSSRIQMEVADVATFTRAVQNIRTGESNAPGGLHACLNDIVEDTLNRTAIAIRRQDWEGYTEARGLEATETHSELLNSIDAHRDPGPEFTRAVINHTPELAAALERLGGDPQHLTALNLLLTAEANGLQTQWAVAADMELFSTAELGTDRLMHEEAWDDVLDYLDYLQQTFPDSPFTNALRQHVMDQIDAELARPFDPNDGPPIRPEELIRDEDSVATTEEERLGIDLRQIEQAVRLADEPLTPEQEREIRQAQRHTVIEMLRNTRNEILATYPTPTAPHAASVAAVAAALLTHELVLQELQRTTLAEHVHIDILHDTLAALWQGSHDPNTVMTLQGLRRAARHLLNFHTTAAQAQVHIRQYERDTLTGNQ